MEEIMAQPQAYLQGAKTYFHYDLFSWAKEKIPAHAISLLAEQYPGAGGQNTGPIPIQTRISYSDGFGRPVQSAMRVESGEAHCIEQNGPIQIKHTENRWLISGRTHYNNKGLPVKQYEPYYLDGCRYVDNPILNRFGVSPTFHYDPLGRLVKTETPKGFFGEVEFTPWLERHYDENDTVVDSKYYGKHSKETADTFKWEHQALEKAAKFYGTPEEKVLDNLGRIIQDIQINVVQNPDGSAQKVPLATLYQWDIQGNQRSSADPRLARSKKKNFETVYSMNGTPLKTVSADAGTRWTLTNAIGNPIYGRDSRGFETYTRYDELHRPVEIRVKDGDGAERLDHVVERMVYGDSRNAEIAKAKEKNLRGQLYLHYDQAGLLRIPLYNCMGLPLKVSRQLLHDYKGEPDWRDTAEQALKRLLQTESYSTLYKYDAMGRVTRETSPDGQATRYTYHRSGHLDQVRVDNDLYVKGTRYNAKGQRLCIEYGNGVATCYEYEPETFRLRRIKTTRQGTKLQDLNYTYDPVGNITHISDRAKDTVFNANQKVAPESDYTYDALYRLIQATGREHPGLSGERKRNGDFDGLSPPQIGDGQALWNYAQNFAYDDAGNLHRILHKGGSDWTRELTVSDRSNRAVDSRSTTKPDQVNDFFDANGNQLRLEGLAGIAWNYRDNIARATVIDRTGESKPSDAEYYVYDGGGSRIRKVTERYAKDSKTLNVEETIYLGSVEIKRIHQGIKVAANAKPTDSNFPLPAGEGRGEGMTVSTLVEERHSHRIMDGDRAIATRLEWKTGKPAEVNSPQIRYQLENHLGSATLELDGEGQIISYEEYYPYGGTAIIMGRNQAEVKLKQYRYSGKERDCTGLYYYGFRYYAPWLGRWLSADPAGTVDGLNLYGFVLYNPATNIDIKGMCSHDVTITVSLDSEDNIWPEIWEFMADSGRIDISMSYRSKPIQKEKSVYSFKLREMTRTKNGVIPLKRNLFHSNAGAYKRYGEIYKNLPNDKKADFIRGVRRVIKSTLGQAGKGMPKGVEDKEYNVVMGLGTLIATSERARHPIAPSLALVGLKYLKENIDVDFMDVFGSGKKPSEVIFIGSGKGGAQALREVGASHYDANSTNETGFKKLDFAVDKIKQDKPLTLKAGKNDNILAYYIKKSKDNFYP